MMLITTRVLIFLVVVEGGNCLKLLSRDKTVTASSIHNTTWIASRAVDGNYRNDADVCKCCAATQHTKDPWFQLDLGATEIIERIEVKGRKNYKEQSLKNMEVYLSHRNKTSSPILTLNNTDVKILNYTLPEPNSSRYVTFISRNNKIYFAICELSVYGPCEKGWYGDNCVNRCGHCKDADQCYDGNGTCPNGCGPGYTGVQCQKPCSQGKYGRNCTEPCGRCKNGDPCNVTNGVCPDGCASGYTGDRCKTACKAGRYGDNCKYTCGTCRDNQPCNISTGICTNGCGLGYTTDYCNKTCDDGNYGDMCGSKCGQCHDDKPCNKTNGHCVRGCQAGYQLPICTSDCNHRTYGKDCKSPCGHCVNDTACDVVNGTCMMCDSDYTGDKCIVKVVSLGGVSDDDKGVGYVEVIVIVVGLAVLAVLICVAVYCIKVKRAKSEVRRRDDHPGRTSNGIDTINPISSAEERRSFIAVKPARPTQPPKTTGREYVPKPSGSKTTTAAVEAAHEGIAENGDAYADDDHQYYGFVVKETELKVHQLWDYIHERKKDKDLLFHREFVQFPTGMQHSNTVALLPGNKPKTRYRGLSAYDNTRVKLETNGTDSDYINACYINYVGTVNLVLSDHNYNILVHKEVYIIKQEGCGELKKFIASQGPTKEMIDDFWLMVWQQKTQQIVMVTNLMEMGIMKCLQYWPNEGTDTFGAIQVTLLPEYNHGDYDIRRLTVQNLKESKPSVIVTQYHYKAWPDKDVPDSTWSLVKFWRNVMDDRDAMEKTGPIVVHCSAGIGRTGTFIALDVAYNQAKLEGSLRFQSIVKSLREQRVKMVQTCKQYVYVHEAVADALLFGTHYVWSNQFDDVYRFLQQPEPGTNNPRLRIQYDILVESIEGTSNTSDQKGQTASRPHTIGKESLGAVLLPDISGQNTFIVAKTPTQGNLMDLWTMVDEQYIKTIVTLVDTTDTMGQDHKIECFHDDKSIKTAFKISLLEEVDKGEYVERELNYNSNTSKGVIVKQFVCSKWPLKPRSMITFLEDVSSCQRDWSDTTPVLVHCSSGFEQSGLVCVLLNELRRMKTDGGHINIIESVKTMKTRNKHIIPTFEQYQYIYDVIQCYLEGGDLYANLC